MRLGCLSSTADLLTQAAQLEQTIVKLYLTWKRLSALSDRLYLDTDDNTPHLRTLLNCLGTLSGETIAAPLTADRDRTVRLQMLPNEPAPVQEAP